MRRRSKLLTFVLVLFVLPAGCYLLRWPLLGGWIRSAAQDGVRESLGISLEMEGLEGTLLTGIRCGNLRGEALSDDAQVRSVRLSGVTLSYNPWKLFQGDLFALSLQVQSADLVLDLDRPGVTDEGGVTLDDLYTPDDLPLVDVASLKLMVEFEGKTLTAKGVDFTLPLPMADGEQHGLLHAESLAYSAPDKTERHWSPVHCPVQYHAGRLQVGPLDLGEKRELLSATLSLTETTPPLLRVEGEGKLLDGAFQYRMETGIAAGEPILGEVRARQLDLAGLGVWQSLWGGDSVPDVQGIIQAEATLQGRLGDSSSLVAAGSVSLADGGYQAYSPIQVALKAGFRADCLYLESCELESGNSRLSLTSGSLPFTMGKPDLDRAEASLALQVTDTEAWLQKAGVKVDRYPALSGSALEGRGKVNLEGIDLDQFLFRFSQGELLFNDLKLFTSGAGFGAEVGGLTGRVGQGDLALLQPARIDCTFNEEATALKTSSLRLSWGPGLVSLEGELFEDLTLKVDGALSGIPPDLILPLLPPDTLPALAWEGLDLKFSLTGGLEAPSAEIQLVLTSFNHEEVDLKALSLDASLTPYRLDLRDFSLQALGSGSIKGRAGCDFPYGYMGSLPHALECDLEVRDLELSCLGRFLPDLEGLDGDATATLTVRGTLASPAVNLELGGHIRSAPRALAPTLPPEVRNSGPWDFALKAETAQDRIQVNSLLFESRLVQLSAQGFYPFSFGYHEETGRFIADAAGDMKVDLSLRDLSLTLFELEPALEGRVEGELLLTGPATYPAGILSARVKGLAAPDFPAHDLAVEGVLEEGAVRIHTCNLVREEVTVLAATLGLDLNGALDRTLALPGPDTRLEGEVRVEGVDVKPYLARFGFPGEGQGSLHLQGGGRLADPAFHIRISLDEAAITVTQPPRNAWENTPVTVVYPYSVEGTMDLDGEALVVHELILKTSEGDMTGSGRLPIGIGWDRLRGGSAMDLEAPLEGEFVSQQIDLTALAGWFTWMRRTSGSLSGKARVSGTLDQPDIQSRFTISGGALRFDAGFPALEELEIEVETDRDKLHVVKLNGTLGGGAFLITGDLPWTGYVPTGFDLALTGREMLLHRGEGIMARADVDVTFTGPMDGPLLAGRIVSCDSRYVKHIPLFGGQGAPAVEGQLQPFSLTDSFSRDMLFDVEITTKTGHPFLINNNLARGGINLDISLHGTGYVPYFLGEASFNDMVLKLPNFNFLLDRGRVVYPRSDPFSPTINVTAHGRRHSYDVDLVVQGLLYDPEIIMTSNPPLRDEAVVLLVTTGYIPDEMDDQKKTNLALTQVGTYLGKELFHGVFGDDSTETGESVIDRFTLSIGTEVSATGNDNVILEYHLEGPWYLQGERDVFSDMNMGVVYRIRFR